MSTFRDAIGRLASDGSDIARFDAVIDAAGDSDVSDQDIAELAFVLGRSGARLAASSDATDVASTGAPGSLSTILGPLICVNSGREVRKVTVPGRPAGSVDVFFGIEGYRADFSPQQAHEILSRSGYVQLLAGAVWAPWDAQLFTRRQERGAQALVPLVIASILAKKVAAGVKRFALDVRWGSHGNFGRTESEADANATQLATVASMLDIEGCCCTSDARVPAQPYIGRGEAILALNSLIENESPDEWLSIHTEQCAELATIATGIQSTFNPEAAARVLMDHLNAQGAVTGAWEQAVHVVQEAEALPICASAEGIFRLDLELTRSAITKAQASATSAATPFPDPCGIRLLCRPGSKVQRDQPLAMFRYQKGTLSATAPLLYAAISVDPQD